MTRCATLMRFSALVLACVFAATAEAGLITSAPGPDEQGGMIMPVVFITNTDNPYAPTRGTIGISFAPEAVPVLAGLQDWWAGAWFDANAAWREDIGSPAGMGGTPTANAGSGDLFNCQYGFTFDANPELGASYVPEGKCLAIRLKSVSSPLLRSFNYDDFDNIWDEVLSVDQPQVLWNGYMWHNYYTLPADAAPGTYTATYEVFIANAEFTYGTGFTDYSPSAIAAEADPNFTPATLTYTWVVPAPPVASIRFVDGNPTISVPSVAGRTYRLQTCGTALGGRWADLGDPKAGNGGILEFEDTTTPRPASRFYQVTETR